MSVWARGREKGESANVNQTIHVQSTVPPVKKENGVGIY